MSRRKIMAELKAVMKQRTSHCGNEFLVHISSAVKQLKKSLKEKEIPFSQKAIRTMTEEMILDMGGVSFEPTMRQGAPDIIYSVRRAQ